MLAKFMLTKLNHFAIYVCQAIILYTLKVCSVAYQLYLNKTGKKPVWHWHEKRHIGQWKE